MDGYEKNAARQFAELLEPHLERLFRFAFRLTHVRDEAEDLFQDVLVKLYPRMDELAELDDPASWLCRVLYNHFIDNRRRYQRRRLVDVAEQQLPGASIADLPYCSMWRNAFSIAQPSPSKIKSESSPVGRYGTVDTVSDFRPSNKVPPLFHALIAASTDRSTRFDNFHGRFSQPVF